MRRALVLGVASLLAACGGGGGELDADAVLERVDAAYRDVPGLEISGRFPGSAQNPAGFRLRTVVALQGGRVAAKEVVRTVRGRADSRLLVTAPEGPSFDWQSGTGCWMRHPPLESIPREELTELGRPIFHTDDMDLGEPSEAGGFLLLPVDFDVPTESTWGDLPLSQRAGYSGRYVLRVEAGSGRVRGLTFVIGDRLSVELAVTELAATPAFSTPEPRC